MKKVRGDIKINEMSIPGTHDSMAYQAVFPLPFVMCQYLTLKEQLKKGFRFFDIRLGVKGDSLGTYHGIFFLKSYFTEVLEEFDSFLKLHPSEGIIIRYRLETGTKNSFCDIFSRLVSKYSHRIWNYGDKSSKKGRNYPSLDDIRGKIVMLQVNQKCDHSFQFSMKMLDNFEGGGYNPFTGKPSVKDITESRLKRRKRSLKSSHLKVRKPSTKKQYCKLLRQAKTKNKNDYYSQGFIENVLGGLEVISSSVLGLFTKASVAYKEELTYAITKTRFEFNDQLCIIFASASKPPKLGPKGFAKDVNPHLRTYLERNNDFSRSGVIVLDFIGQEADLPQIIYRRNFRGVM